MVRHIDDVNAETCYFLKPDYDDIQLLPRNRFERYIRSIHWPYFFAGLILGAVAAIAMRFAW
jgi:hypothetical protein